MTFKELAALDPYGIRQLAHTKLGEEFLKNKPERKEKIKSAESGETVSVEEAKEIMERNRKNRFFGPEEVKKLSASPWSSYLPFLSQEKKLRERKNLNTD